MIEKSHKSTQINSVLQFNSIFIRNKLVTSLLFYPNFHNASFPRKQIIKYQEKIVLELISKN